MKGGPTPPFKSGIAMGGWDLGDWTAYSNIRFRQDYISVVVNAGMEQSSVPATLTLLLDSLTGEQIAEINLNEATGDWSMYKAFWTNIDVPVTSYHTVYLLAQAQNGLAGIANIDYIELSTSDFVPSVVKSIAKGENLDVMIYPNPANTYLNIKINEPVKKVDLTIINSFSQVVKNDMYTDTFFKVPVDDLPYGVYFMIVKIADKTLTKKIVITK
ncbi:MAG: carbohydrate-binding protein [Bacteroidales bacterium]|nr:carbohydrate-binding protein [Bacteroidales bacterium]